MSLINLKLICKGLIMYHAIGYNPSTKHMVSVYFKAENDEQAYHYIVNHYDCSLTWRYNKV
jgi:hypothetical protein